MTPFDHIIQQHLSGQSKEEGTGPRTRSPAGVHLQAILSLVLTATSFLAVCGSTVVATVAAEERPNIILFLIDDQNPSSIAAFGGDTYTPNLDRMAAEGMKFTRAYVSSTVCTPSRYSFLTGRYAGNSHSKSTSKKSAKKRIRDFPVSMSPWNATR